ALNNVLGLSPQVAEQLMAHVVQPILSDLSGCLANLPLPQAPVALHGLELSRIGAYLSPFFDMSTEEAPNCVDFWVESMQYPDPVIAAPHPFKCLVRVGRNDAGPPTMTVPILVQVGSPAIFWTYDWVSVPRGGFAEKEVDLGTPMVPFSCGGVTEFP